MTDNLYDVNALGASMRKIYVSHIVSSKNVREADWHNVATLIRCSFSWSRSFVWYSTFGSDVKTYSYFQRHPEFIFAYLIRSRVILHKENCLAQKVSCIEVIYLSSAFLPAQTIRTKQYGPPIAVGSNASHALSVSLSSMLEKQVLCGQNRCLKDQTLIGDGYDILLHHITDRSSVSLRLQPSWGIFQTSSISWNTIFNIRLISGGASF